MNSSDLPNDIKWSINEYLVDTKTIYNNRRDLINELKPVIRLLDFNTSFSNTKFTKCYKIKVRTVINTFDRNKRLEDITNKAVEIKWGICDCCYEILDEEKIISLKKKLCYFWRKYKYTSDISQLIDVMDEFIVNCIHTSDPSQKTLDYFFSCESLDNLSKDYHYLIERFLQEYDNCNDTDSDSD